MATKAQREEMLLAERRGELIEKELVRQQAAYLLVAFRQKMLTLGQTLGQEIRRLERCARG